VKLATCTVKEPFDCLLKLLTKLQLKSDVFGNFENALLHSYLLSATGEVAPERIELINKVEAEMAQT
jgi:hypothetical protein